MTFVRSFGSVSLCLKQNLRSRLVIKGLVIKDTISGVCTESQPQGDYVCSIGLVYPPHILFVNPRICFPERGSRSLGEVSFKRSYFWSLESAWSWEVQFYSRFGLVSRNIIYGVLGKFRSRRYHLWHLGRAASADSRNPKHPHDW